jgi:quinoprotein glucose dehydrogenase
MTSHSRPSTPLVFGILIAIVALALGAAGAWLIALGGSWYYLVAAVLLLATAGLLIRRSDAALWSYGFLLAATLAWSLWEVGLDWWPLAARLGVPFVIGLLLVGPWMVHSLGEVDGVDLRGRLRANSASWKRGGGLVLSIALAATLLTMLGALTQNAHDIEGSLPSATASSTESADTAAIPDDEWHAYGRTGHGQRYSPLAQITPNNVSSLKVAWQYRTGDLRGKEGDPVETTYEVTPLKVGNSLYFCTPHQLVIALNATTGEQLWRYDPKIEGELALQHLTCRGLAYQAPSTADTSQANAASTADAVTPAPAVAAATGTAADGALPIASALGAVSGQCEHGKLFMPTADGRLIALNPDNGQVCGAFGNGKGQIDLLANMPNARRGAYYSTSPVVVTQRLVIIGGTVLDNVSTKEQSGVIRAFDIETGALAWNWDSGNPDVTAPIAPGESYTANSPNSWSISSADEALGMVYIPMGNQPPDQWGGKRSEAVEKYASSVVALDIATGKVRWVFQTVHHDLWDYDVPAQPSLVDLTIAGAVVPALVQPTKQGELFVLDRRTGTPINPVTEVAAPQGAAPGDHTAATQPKTALSFAPPKLSGRDMWGATMFDQLACRIAFHRLRYEGRFTPPSTQGSLVYPGNFGVFNWGSVAVDPQRQIAFTTPTYVPFVSKLIPRPNDTALMVQGDGQPKGALPALNENFGAPFAAKLSPFLSPLGIPCIAPPWGYVAGADLVSGKIVWKHRNGTVRDLSPVPLPLRMGVPNIGGPVMTAGGVAFLSGTLDNYVRGYDVTNGKQLWESRLPAGGQATPMTYAGKDGRQYLVVVAGGHGSTQTKSGDYVIAYALPK